MEVSQKDSHKKKNKNRGTDDEGENVGQKNKRTI
jgi:hypothetical protein